MEINQPLAVTKYFNHDKHVAYLSLFRNTPLFWTTGLQCHIYDPTTAPFCFADIGLVSPFAGFLTKSFCCPGIGELRCAILIPEGFCQDHTVTKAYIEASVTKWVFGLKPTFSKLLESTETSKMTIRKAVASLSNSIIAWFCFAINDASSREHHQYGKNILYRDFQKTANSSREEENQVIRTTKRAIENVYGSMEPVLKGSWEIMPSPAGWLHRLGDNIILDFQLEIKWETGTKSSKYDFGQSPNALLCRGKEDHKNAWTDHRIHLINFFRFWEMAQKQAAIDFPDEPFDFEYIRFVLPTVSDQFGRILQQAAAFEFHSINEMLEWIIPATRAEYVIR